MAALLEPLTQAAEAVRAPVDEALAEAARLEQLARADPLLSLSGDELSRASGLATFAQQDCEKLSLRDLAVKLESLLAGNDRVQKLVFLRYAQDRRQAVRQAMHVGTPIPADFEPVGDAICKLEAATRNPQALKLATRAADLRTRVRAVLADANQARPNNNGPCKPAYTL